MNQSIKVLITGTSQGIGKAIAEHFLEMGHKVIGIDRQEPSIFHSMYSHHQCDISDYKSLPEIDDVEILINNAVSFSNCSMLIARSSLQLKRL